MLTDKLISSLSDAIDEAKKIQAALKMLTSDAGTAPTAKVDAEHPSEGRVHRLSWALAALDGNMPKKKGYARKLVTEALRGKRFMFCLKPSFRNWLSNQRRVGVMSASLTAEAVIAVCEENGIKVPEYE
jgi:hypothetical protein